MDNSYFGLRYKGVVVWVREGACNGIVFFFFQSMNEYQNVSVIYVPSVLYSSSDS